MSQTGSKLEILINSFNQLFEATENTLLKAGADEPFYRAPFDGEPGVIFSREDYFSSALHEIAHWCIAGIERRKVDDFGYWYKPEGRTLREQLEFERVEVKPQAIEWALSLACDHPFHFSADNLSQEIDATEAFKSNVEKQLSQYLNHGLPARAQVLFDQLNGIFRHHHKVEDPVCLPLA